jgi:nicotinate-nucleotide adenylyltransferase
MIGVMGGTFDPVHLGHLRAALETVEALDLDVLRLIPCGDPPHRAKPLATGAQRLHMLRLSLADEASLLADDLELVRPGPSFTVDTLAVLRAQLGPKAPLCLVLGTDAFARLYTWSRWESLLDLAHIVALMRPGSALPESGVMADMLGERRVGRAPELRERSHGAVFCLAVTGLDISARSIRSRIAHAKSARYLLPEPVWQYIRAEGLYSDPEAHDGQ